MATINYRDGNTFYTFCESGGGMSVEVYNTDTGISRLAQCTPEQAELVRSGEIAQVIKTFYKLLWMYSEDPRPAREPRAVYKPHGITSIVLTIPEEEQE